MTDSAHGLPELDAAEERRLTELLRCAFAPKEIENGRHERLLKSALEDPFAEPSAEELVESARLRDALEGHGAHPSAALALALSSAFTPSTVPPKAEPPALPAARAGKLIFFRYAGVAASLAVAAGVLLAVSQRSPASSAPELPALALARSRTTASLFQADAAGAASDRIDRIASARGRELRDNRYALWGVK